MIRMLVLILDVGARGSFTLMRNLEFEEDQGGNSKQ